MFGGTEGDKLQGGPGNDEAYGGPGIDLIQGGPGTGSGSGATDGNDVLVGDEDPDSIEGGSGDDMFYGDHFLASAGSTRSVTQMTSRTTRPIRTRQPTS